MDIDFAKQIYRHLWDNLEDVPTTEAVHVLLSILARITIECSGDIGPTVMGERVVDQYRAFLQLLIDRQKGADNEN